MKFKRFVSIVLMLCVLASTCAVAVSAADITYIETGAQVELDSTGKSYGLMDNIQDGNILHCFDWTYSDVTAMLPQIAEAGFTSVQLSPIQDPKEHGAWYWAYQPRGFWIGTNNPMGNESSLKTLCSEADKYGIKVVMDVVANHLADPHDVIDNELKDGQYWHYVGGVSNWNDRYQVTNGNIGMQDLNTAHSTVQNKVKKYLEDLKACGVDGIRWDAAKHIGLPSEGDSFWSAVTTVSGLYHYGEILDSPGGDAGNILKEYTQYMSVTDSGYSGDVRRAFAGGNCISSNAGWVDVGISSGKLVYWAESHDTYSNENKESTYISQNAIDRAYAVIASRKDASALYFSRPSATDKDSIRMGQKGSTHFTSAEVAAVNHFRNAMSGQKEYLTSGSNCTVICREQGAVIVAGSGGNFSVNVPNGGSTVKPGTYTDEVTGATWTVTSSSISGNIGSSGIAVIYNPTKEPTVSVSQKGGSFKTDTLTLTLELSNATSGTYSVDGGTAKSFTGSTTITIGKGVAVGKDIVVKLTATDGSTETEISYTFKKADPNVSGIYFDNSSKKWSAVNCYIYSSDNEQYTAWPGTPMNNEGNNIWFMEIPSGYENCYVIFNDGGSNQIPGAQEKGFTYSDSPMIYKNGNWEEHTPVVTTPTKVTDPTTKPTTQNTTQKVTDAPELPTGKVLLGDADGNGIVNIKDATKIQQVVASGVSVDAKSKNASDVDGNGTINIKDASFVQKYVAGVTLTYKIGKYIDVNGEVVEPDPTEPSSPEVVPTNPTTQPTTATPGKNTLYFNNTASWQSVYAYVWSSDGELADWPGLQMIHVAGSVYKFEFDEKYDNIIFNPGSGIGKTGDLSVPGTNRIFDYKTSFWSVYSGNPNDYGIGTNIPSEDTVTIRFIDSAYWGYVKAVCWKNSSSQQRDEFEMYSMGNNMYEAQVPKGYDKIYFTNGNQWCQDQNFPAGGGTFDYYTGWK